MTNDPSRLSIGVIGTGRVGSVLGGALSRVGHRVVAASGVSQRSLDLAARHLPGVPLVGVPEVIAAADLVLLAVPDPDLPELVAGAATVDSWRRGQLVAHTSGVHGLAVLEPAVRAGALPLALHPVMTFSGRAEDADRIAGVSYGVTAPDRLRPVAEALVVEMGGEPVWISEEHRMLYHAALTIGASHLVTAVNEAIDLLGRVGADHPGIVLAPLLGAALDNALRSGDNALCGPVVTGDSETVARDVAVLRAESPDSVATYLAMARRTADRALSARRLSAEDAEALLEVLSEG